MATYTGPTMGTTRTTAMGGMTTAAGEKRKRKVYAGLGPRALRKGPLTSKLARASPKVPQNYTSYS
eukprot:1159832-Pelagomonas_calceolata.AAC.17